MKERIELLESLINKKYRLNIKSKSRKKEYIRARWIYGVVGIYTLGATPAELMKHISLERSTAYNTVKKAQEVLEEENRTGKYYLTGEIKVMISSLEAEIKHFSLQY